MDEAMIRKRCEEIRLLWRSMSKGNRAANVREAIYRAAYADGQRDGMERAAAIAERNRYMGSECDPGGNYGGPEFCEYGCGQVIAVAIHQAAREVGRE